MEIPQISSNSKSFKTSTLSDSPLISKTSDDSYFFACLLAAFANVFVGPMPIDIGIPVHCLTSLLISFAVSVKSVSYTHLTLPTKRIV